MGKFDIIHANIMDYQPDEPFHALFLDPPYHLGKLSQRYKSMSGKGDVYQNAVERTDPYARTANGFMNTAWDAGDLFMQPATWNHLLHWLYPGGFAAAYSSPVSYHRIAVAAEDGGFDVHPAIYNYVSGQLVEYPLPFLGWMYAGGMPKASNISYWLERELCVKTCQCGYFGPAGKSWSSCPECHRPGTKRNGVKWRYADDMALMRQKPPYRQPTAQRFAGHRYGHQLMAPAFEPILLIQRPYDSDRRPVDQIVEHGAGCLNVDDCRIPYVSEDDLKSATYGAVADITGGGYNSHRASNGYVHDTNVPGNPAGRWPNNLILTCHCDPLRPDQDSHDTACPVYLTGRQAGVTRGGSPVTGNEPSGLDGKTKHTYGEYEAIPQPGHNDSGTVDRYFHQFGYEYELYESIKRYGGPGIYHGKVKSADERDAGIDGPVLIQQRLNAGVLSEEHRWAKQDRKNPHPTLKSIGLNIHISTLLSIPDHYTPRRLGIPCNGVGSEMIGALLSGRWESVTGIELTNTDEAPYVDISRQRVAWWLEQYERGFRDIPAILDEWRRQQWVEENGGTNDGTKATTNYQQGALI
jgi:hypothetical protein